MTAHSGFTFDANDRLLVSDLVATAVPSTAVFHNGLAFKASDGSLYVTSSAPSSPAYIRGMAVRQDGALHVVTVAPSPIYDNGLFPANSSGQVYIVSGGTIAVRRGGIGLTSDRGVATV